MNIPNAPLKGVFFIHFILSMWALQSPWLPSSYLYYNSIFLVTLLWSLHWQDSDEPVFMALVIDAISILLDIITISIYYQNTHNDKVRGIKFSAGMCILNLILRVVSVFILLKVFQERGGHYDNLGIPGIATGSRGTYDNIDYTGQQSVPKTTIDTTHEHSPDAMLPSYHNP
ncbi:type-1 angiotensin II receptor-associated protein-like [Limulus polyphemus]|uniref:Type-1 angiotensin II receptor-associated protein-like n=1 Tax=Limulus polyphemus TaxID=6850 RepID=A0ABM1TJ50_LIMPO|nr:type-1 angiotensin II receptor-associated protein-like [Limulus polyphemus]XP_013787644.1 type-1 angiotensin II receptor-associated protein-like [Limulus polyphemus]XP_022255906.1 type-1 angiotensin II receptor-associated protein-like [Limulus polyphemus]XP_022255907.1 type-1 angiotensin II receptor-associated protein-like [Limulus polyphemus]XP_022255908.1 type-1 angiotensin II receptor-associated protein-like [Limulus polyphemus]XP_022255909.1 type-1 angiotensin II receptor-associated pro